MIRIRFVPFRYLFHAIAVLRGKFDDDKDEGELTHFQALTTALSATVGMGNIAGVAVAITLGGPGAVFLDVGECRHWNVNQVLYGNPGHTLPRKR